MGEVWRNRRGVIEGSRCNGLGKGGGNEDIFIFIYIYITYHCKRKISKFKNENYVVGWQRDNIYDSVVGVAYSRLRICCEVLGEEGVLRYIHVLVYIYRCIYIRERSPTSNNSIIPHEQDYMTKIISWWLLIEIVKVMVYNIKYKWTVTI